MDGGLALTYWILINSRLKLPVACIVMELQRWILCWDTEKLMFRVKTRRNTNKLFITVWIASEHRVLFSVRARVTNLY